MISNTVHGYFAQVLLPANQKLWQGLAFHAGYLNAAGFLACHRFVSHMTGFGSQVGLNIGANEYLFAFEMVLAPVFFMVGATYAGVLVDRRMVKNSSPRLIQGISVILLINILILVFGKMGLFGYFGEPLTNQRDFVLLFLLTFCCGLQNGLFVSITSGLIRTTHITGLCTDIGLNIVRLFTLPEGETKAKEAQKNWLRLKTIIAFSVGSGVSALIFSKFGYLGFLGSVFFSFGLLLYTKYLMVMNVSVLKNPVEVRT